MRMNPTVAKRALSRRMQIKDEKELEDTYQLLKSFVQVSRIQLWKASKLFSKIWRKEYRRQRAPIRKIT